MTTTTSEITLDTQSWKALVRIKNFARIAIGFVWLWEGLVPKILAPSVLEVEMVLRSGWWWGSPEMTLYWLGAAQIIAGLAIISGLWERLGIMVATLSLLVLIWLVVANHPAALVDPFGGLIKDACLFACAALVWWFPTRRTRQTVKPVET